MNDNILHVMARTKIFFIAILFSFCFACSKTKTSESKPLLLVSIAPYQFLTERIAGKDFVVQSVAPLGADPHTYEPTSGQVVAIGKGTLWFTMGEPFEKKILTVLHTRNPEMSVVDLRRGIPLLEDPSFCCAHHSATDRHDRHFWLSPKTASLQTEIIAQALSEKFPERREDFLANATQLQKELHELDLEIAALLAPVKDRVLLVSHPAFGYFCHDYALTQLSVEFEGKEPRPKHLEAVLAEAIAKHAEVALALPQHNNKGAQLIAGKLHVPVRMINPYSSDYFATMRLLARIIADPQYQP